MPGNRQSCPGVRGGVLRGRDQTRGQEGPGSTIRRDTPQTRLARGRPRPRTGPAPPAPQGADSPAPEPAVRTVRTRRNGGRPPRRRAQATRETRTAPAPVGGTHGEEAPQDAH